MNPRCTFRLAPWALSLLFSALCVLTPLSAPAADAQVKLTAAAAPERVRAGETVVVEIQAAIPAGYHLYSFTNVPDGPLPLKAQAPGSQLAPLGDWHAPAPHVEVDPNFNKAVEFYEGRVAPRRAFKHNPVEPGPTALEFTISGQICSAKQCLSFKESVSAPLVIEAGSPRAELSEIPVLAGEAFPDDRAPPQLPDASHGGESLPLGEGMASFLVIAFLAGLGALVTPCVFPMIPITMSFFSKFARVSMKRSVAMASIYTGSIVLTFTLLGVLISLLFGAVGMQILSASAGFNIFLFLLLVVFAFNLFGLFEIQIPGWLVTKSAKKEYELSADDGSLARQALGVFFMAITFSLVSFTCTVGFIGVVLAEAAKGNWFYPAVGMLAFSLAFSLPFFVLAVFPSWADKLKNKRGDWMVAVKVVLGFIELAGAFKFLSNVDLIWHWEVVTRPFVLACWGGIFLCAGLYLLRVFTLPGGSESRTVGPIRMTFAMLMLSLSAFSLTGVRDTKSMGGWIDGWLPPPIYPGQELSLGDDGAPSDHLVWLKDDIPAAMAQGRTENQPVFIDFTGYTCTNCRYMELSVFPRPESRSQLEKMVRVSAYTDCTEPVCQEQRDMQIKRYDTAALPFYAIINPHDDSVISTFASSTNDAKEYGAWLSQALAKWNRVKPQGPSVQDKTDAPVEPKPDGAQLQLIESGPPVDLVFPDIKTGEDRTLSSLRGGWVLLNFWASWCSPCMKELQHDFPGALAAAPHVKLLTVSFDGEDTKPASLRFIDKVPLLGTTTNLLGGDDATNAGLDPLFGAIESFPVSYLIHPDGHIAWQLNGSVTKELLDEVLALTKP